MKFIFKMCKLDIIASKIKCIKVALTLDSAKLTNYLSYMIYKVKIIHIRARSPRTNRLVIDFQSIDHLFIFESYIMKNNKDTYKCFKGFFDWSKKLCKEGLNEYKFNLKNLSLLVTVLYDLSSTWKILLVREVAKVVTRLYHLYLVSSTNIAHFKSEEESCETYKEDNYKKYISQSNR